MLGVRSYTQDYVVRCRSRIDADLSAYTVSLAVGDKIKRTMEFPVDSSIEAFETVFFNNMLLVLDHLFVHRLRTIEGKDGNPLNEVRMLGDCLMSKNGVMRGDRAIRLSPGRSMLKYQVGDQIRPKEDDFVLMSRALVAGIESKFVL